MSKAKIIKGLLSLFKEKTSKNKARRIIETEMPGDEFFGKQPAATQQKNLSPLQEEMDRMLALEKSNLEKLKIQSAEMDEMTKVLDEFNRIADEDGIEAALKAMEGLLNPKRTLNAAGGRVGLEEGGLSDLNEPMTNAEISARVKDFNPKLKRFQNALKLSDKELAESNLSKNDIKTAIDNLKKIHSSYATPYYSVDEKGDRVFENTFLADIMQKGKPPVPGLALTKDEDKKLKQYTTDFNKKFEEMHGRPAFTSYDRIITEPGQPHQGGYSLDDHYDSDFKNRGNKVVFQKSNKELAANPKLFDEILYHEGFLHPELGQDRSTLGFDPLDKNLSKVERAKNIEQLKNEIYEDEKGRYDLQGEEAIARAAGAAFLGQKPDFSVEDLYGGNFTKPSYNQEPEEEEVLMQLKRLQDKGFDISDEYKDTTLQELGITENPYRVGMLTGGLAKGIMQAVKAAKKGYKPFGEKQTYKQNLQNLGLANEQALVSNFANKLDKIMKTKQSQIPEEDLFDLFENIATGKQYDMVSTPIKKDMLGAVMQAMRTRNVDGGDFQNFIADIAPRARRDVFPNDIQSLLKQIDQSDALMEQLKGKASSKIIPFKPKIKKADGGRIGFKDGDKVDTMFQPRYDSSSGEYDVKGGAKVGPFDISVGGRGNENYDMSPIMEYEAGLDLPNDFRLTGGYYDDAIMEDGMMSPEDQIRLQIEKRFNQGGLVPPEKGPVSDGMGSLFRRK